MKFLQFSLLCFLVSVSAQAETVVLVRKDAIHGEITEKTDSSIILIHKVLGKLEIPKDQIASISVVHDVLGEIEIPRDQIFLVAAGKPDVETVVLVGEDSIHGEITEKTDSSIILVHKVLGTLEIPKDQIEKITFVHDILGEITIPAYQIISSPTVEPEKEKPETTAAADRQKDQQQTKEEENKEMLFEPEFEKLDALAGRLKKGKWSFALDFSINTSSGNTNEETTRLGTHIKRMLPRERMTLDASYYHKKNRGAITDNEFTIGLLKDWLNPGSRWFFFGTSRFDYDEFESWQQRANIQIGPGYHLITSDDMLLNLRLGAGGRKEWGSLNNNLKFEGLAGIDFTWQLTEKQTIESAVWFFPVLTDFDDYRTRSSLNWRYELSKELNLSLLLGLLHEYQSIVDPDRDNSDTRVYTGLQIEF